MFVEFAPPQTAEWLAIGLANWFGRKARPSEYLQRSASVFRRVEDITFLSASQMPNGWQPPPGHVGILIHWGVYGNRKFRLHRRRVALSRRFARATLNRIRCLHARPNVITPVARDNPLAPRCPAALPPRISFRFILLVEREVLEAVGGVTATSIMHPVTPLNVPDRGSFSAPRVPTSFATKKYSSYTHMVLRSFV